MNSNYMALVLTFLGGLILVTVCLVIVGIVI